MIRAEFAVAAIALGTVVADGAPVLPTVAVALLDAIKGCCTSAQAQTAEPSGIETSAVCCTPRFMRQQQQQEQER